MCPWDGEEVADVEEEDEDGAEEVGDGLEVGAGVLRKYAEMRS